MIWRLDENIEKIKIYRNLKQIRNLKKIIQ